MSDDPTQRGRDERPRPQYGEYAPEGWVSPATGHGVDAGSGHGQAAGGRDAAVGGSPAVHPANVDGRGSARPTTADRPERRTWDILLTVVLLGLGLYTVGSGYLAYSNLGEVMDQVFRQIGIGGFTSVDLAATLGVVIMVSHTIIWIAGALLGARALKRNKIAFIWPLAAGVLATLVVFVLIAILMISDPSFAAYLEGMSP